MFPSRHVSGVEARVVSPQGYGSSLHGQAQGKHILFDHFVLPQIHHIGFLILSEPHDAVGHLGLEHAPFAGVATKTERHGQLRIPTQIVCGLGREEHAVLIHLAV